MSETRFQNDPEFDPTHLAELRRIETPSPGEMRLIHATNPLAAESILADGFRDGEKTIGGMPIRDVFLSNRPLDPNEGTKGSTLLIVDIEIEMVEIEKFEILDESATYREFVLPAELIHARGTVCLGDHDA